MKNLIDQLATIGIVTMVTLLVWLYAEDANIEEYTDQSVRLEFVVPGGEDNDLMDPSAPVTVKVDFDGSNGQYQQFLEKTRDEPIEIDVPIDPALDLQTIDVDIRERLERFVFSKLGINVTGVSPERVPVTYEKMVERTLDIQLIEDTGGIKLSAKQIPVAENQRITVTLPAGQVDRLNGRQATVRIRERDVTDLVKGEPRPLTLPIELPSGVEGIESETTQVVVLVTVANDRGKVTIDRRPIRLSYPPSINERYIVDIDESDRFITSFELEGPREQIELLRQDQASTAVWATVRLSNEEADAAAANGGELTKAVEIIAPPGVVLSSDVVRVTVRVKPREATPEP